MTSFISKVFPFSPAISARPTIRKDSPGPELQPPLADRVSHGVVTSPTSGCAAPSYFHLFLMGALLAWPLKSHRGFLLIPPTERLK